MTLLRLRPCVITSTYKHYQLRQTKIDKNSKRQKERNEDAENESFSLPESTRNPTRAGTGSRSLFAMCAALKLKTKKKRERKRKERKLFLDGDPEA